jgi:hypothetical protein
MIGKTPMDDACTEKSGGWHWWLAVEVPPLKTAAVERQRAEEQQRCPSAIR